MFEDDDTFRQQEGLTEHENEDKGREGIPRILYIIVLWLIWATVLTIIFLPKIKTAFEKSGAAELISAGLAAENAKATKPAAEKEVAFYGPEGLSFYSVYTPDRGGSSYHNTIEALLLGPDEKALKKGAITLIAPGTKLVGLSVQKGKCYVALSKEFLKSNEELGKEIPSEQIKMTLEHQKGIQSVTILVDGNTINE